MNTSSTSPPPLPPDASAPRTSGLAIASLVLGILSLFLNVLASIPAIICGILALIGIKNSRGRLTGKGLAISGIVTSLVFSLLLRFCSFFSTCWGSMLGLPLFLPSVHSVAVNKPTFGSLT